MKKIAFLLAAVALTAAVNAQVVVSLQGGYYQKSITNNINVDAITNNNWLAGAQIGYMITPRLYVGVSGNFNNFTNDTMETQRTIVLNAMPHIVTNYHTNVEYSGWSVSPQVKYEFMRYGNMHFHMLLGGTYSKLGYRTTVESYNDYINGGQYIERPSRCDSIGTTTWMVSLRPTISYDFSQHLSAELSLDFLSVGYASQSRSNDRMDITDKDGKTAHPTTTSSTLYAGLNTLMETLQWESPMLRLGFNWTF